MRSRLASLATCAGAAGLLVLAAPLPFAHGAEASQECDGRYNVYSAVSAAAGMQVTTAPGSALPVNQGDAGLPTAQAHIGSLSGSQAYAGAPYSEAAAGNLGVAGSQLGVPLTPNQVPVFSQSKYPTDLHDEKSNAAYAISTTVTRQSAKAAASGGAPATPVGAAGRTDVNATTNCSAAAVMQALADNDVDSVDVASVLRIAHVNSHAQAQLGPTGLPVLAGSMEVDGASVLGTAVGVSDKGLVVAGTAVPLPDGSPLSSALATAGISLRYLAAEKNPATGTVVAPGLEITVRRDFGSTAGLGKTVTTFTLGQAVASVSRSGDAPAPVPTDDGTYTPQPQATEPVPPAPPQHVGPGPALPVVPGPGAASEPPSIAPEPATRAAQQALPVVVQQAFRPWSIARLYVAMSIAMCVLLLPSIGIKRVAVIRR